MLFFKPNTSPSGNAPPPSRTHHHHLLGVVLTNMVGFVNSDIAAFHGLASAIAHQTLSSPATASATAPGSSGMAATVGLQRPSQQGLSVSLSSQQAAFNRSLSGELDVLLLSLVSAMSPTSYVRGGNDIQIPSSSSWVSNGIPSMQSVTLGSKYLKAAQELLDEVVNVGK